MLCVQGVCGLALSASAALNVTGLSPANGTTNVCTDTLLRITFDASPSFDKSGLIRIYTSTGVLVDTIDLSLNVDRPSSPNVQTRTIGIGTYYTYPIIVSGNTATIYPHAGVLATNQSYYVNITPNLFTNSSSGGFAGISDTNTWSFTTKPVNPLVDTNHLIVAADGSGDFCTVQGALDFIPTGNTPRLIDIRNGVYEEIVYHIQNKNNIHYRGGSRDGTIIKYANNANLNPGGSYGRYLFWMRGDDVSMENLTVTNSTPDGGSQAEALRAEGRRFVFNHGKVASFQDSLLLNSFGRYSYFYDSLIQGDTDYIWNDGIGVFQNCEIRTMNPGYTCQMRSEASPYKGALFLDCTFTKAYNFTGHYFARIAPSSFPYSFTALVNCKLDNHIAPAGWLVTDGGSTSNLRFWEYQSTDLTGTNLVDVSSRASFSKQLTASEADALRNLTNVYWPNSLWLPQLAPNIINQPTNQTVPVASNATFTVQATGIETANPASPGDPSIIVPLSYQWLKDGTNVPGATNASLTISNAQAADAGTYSLVVTNLSGSMVSSNALLVVEGPSQPVIESVLLTNGQFSLTFDGDSGLNYGVQRSTNLIDWQTVFTTNAPALPYLWKDTDATVPERFYRILVNP